MPLKAGQHYYRLWLSDMRLAHDRRWFQEWHPVVHLLVRCRYAGEEREIPYVAGPLAFSGVSEEPSHHVVQLDHPATSLMPFDGSDVRLAAGLLAIPGRDWMREVIGVVERFSTLLAQPQLSAALAVAKPLADGMRQLVGGTEGQLHLGLQAAWEGAGGAGGSPMSSGYLVVLRAREDEVDTERLWVKDGRLRIGDSLTDSAPLSGITYMLFRIQAADERPDWRSFPTIRDPLSAALRALAEGRADVATAKVRTAIAAAFESADLTTMDQQRVAIAIAELWKAQKAAFEGLGATAPADVDLDEIALPTAPQMEAAPRPTLDGLLAEV